VDFGFHHGDWLHRGVRTDCDQVLTGLGVVGGAERNR
jgi:hypothetical protein